jgi:hypothetical protein
MVYTQAHTHTDKKKKHVHFYTQAHTHSTHLYSSKICITSVSASGCVANAVWPS